AGGEEDLLSGLAAAERAEPAGEVSPQPSAGETLAHLDQMSDEEVEKLLNQLRE
ncbi:MAG: hypothetical protein GTO03_00320, partial [Planctomycetales bacterium]|nr:hypothetical protein [Planctomycetales bacterium]